MDLNSFVFPIPAPSYTQETFKEELIWIPRKENYSYKDKIRFSAYKSLIPHNETNLIPLNETDEQEQKENKFKSRHRYSSSMIQKIPSISFAIDNKFKVSNTYEDKTTQHIPCLFLSETSSDKVLIFFHANYEDLGNTHLMCSVISKCLKINVLSVEYPCYGLYQSKDRCNSEAILKDSGIVYKFLNEVMGVPETNILVMGRCIGSGPAVHLAKTFNPISLILLSPFKSIQAVVKFMFDKLKFGWMFEKLIKQR